MTEKIEMKEVKFGRRRKIRDAEEKKGDKNMNEVIIIGAGAAGLMAAVGAGSESAARNPQCGEAISGKSIVLEKMPRPGRKIMITGKGRCNFTNVKDWNEFSEHVHPKANALKPAFYNLTPERLIGMFNENGLETVVERGDRAFPTSYASADVVDTLADMAEKAGAQILCNKEVISIDIQPNTSNNASKHLPETPNSGIRLPGNIFTVKCADGSEYHSVKLIITTGGLSYPATGSSGDGLRWAEEMGLSTKTTFPSLTALVPKGYKQILNRVQDDSFAAQDDSAMTRRCSGMAQDDSAMTQRWPGMAQDDSPVVQCDSTVQDTKGSHAEFSSASAPKTTKGHIDRSTPLSETGSLLKDLQLKNVNLSISINGNPAQEEFGDIAFTDGGLEGPLGFKVSRKAVNALINGSKVMACIDMKPAVTAAELEGRIASLWRDINDDRRNARKQYKDKMYFLMQKLMPRDMIEAFIRTNSELSHKNIGKALKAWKFEIAGYVGYERCVVTAGGVDCSEIIAKSMESKKIKGLYLAGEVLDLDADTGGYNLHIAFATGFLAGQSAAFYEQKGLPGS